MRFGKRSKNPLSWGWRGASVVEAPLPEESDGSASESTEVQPIQKLAIHNPEVPSTMARSGTGDHVVTSDPTQRLLTSLGRFQRHFMKAREGAPQAQWSDECMNHLIHGVEIALEQGWTDLVEALTETGRILQSYEDAGRANECVHFLADSYEIMCLMVGDLIVDKVRPGVLRKWRDCYQNALEDLSVAGLQLVQDDDSSRFHSHGTADAQAPAAGTPETHAGEGFDSPDLASDLAPSSFGGLEELPPLTPLDSGLSGETPEMPFSADDAEEVESPFGELMMDEEPFDATDLAPPEFDIPLEPGADAMEESYAARDAEMDATASEAPSSDAGHGLGAGVAETLDMLCDGLARIEGDPNGARGTVFLAIEDGLASLREWAGQQGWSGSLAACDAMSRLCQAGANPAAPLGDRFFETAYAFGGVYGEVQDQIDDESLRSWIVECDTLIDELSGEPSEAESQTELPSDSGEETPFEIPVSTEATEDVNLEMEVPSLENDVRAESPPPLPPELPVESESEAVEADEAQITVTPSDSDEQFVEISSAVPPPIVKSPDDDPAAHFLETARQAIGSGATADAKLFAMQAAASIAQAQAKEAESRVRQAEIRLQETVKSIESARDQVKAAEAQVEQAETRVEEGKEQLADRGRHTHGVLGSLEGIRSRIADLDRRIQELQAQRDEATRQQSAAEDALSEARQQESDVKTQLDELKNAEQMARVQLEDSRGQVKLLQRKQGEIEALMERARDSLTKFRESMADIDRTIELIRNAETSAALENDDLLF